MFLHNNRTRILLTGITFACSVLFAQSGPSKQIPRRKQQPSRELVLSGEKSVNSEFANLLYGPQKCDGEGNLFFQTNFTGTEPLKKLSLKGERIAQFSPRASGMSLDGVNYFTVDSSGNLYVLAFPHEINRYVLASKSDGTFQSAIKLDTSFAWIPSALAVFPTGGFLVTGLAYNKDNPVMVPFTGIFGADGAPLKEIKLSDDDDLYDMAASGDPRVVTSANSNHNHAVSASEMEAGTDGNIYLMRALNPAIIYAISPGGDVVRRFTVDPGNGGSKIVTMHTAPGKLAVLFWDPATATDIIKVVDLEGHEIGTYREIVSDKSKSDRIGTAFACYLDNPERFVFLSFEENNQLDIEVAEGR